MKAILFSCVLVSILLIPAARGVRCAEFRIEPSLTLSQEYNDNIFLTPDNKVDDYLTRAIPSIHLLYKSPFWDWDVSYAYDYRHYARKTYEEDSTHRLMLTNTTRVIADLFMIDVRDEYRRVSLFVARDYTEESLVVNQTDQNIFTVKPYLELRPTGRLTITTGYEYRDFWYDDPTAINKTEHAGFADLKHEFSPRFHMTGTFRYTETETAITEFDRTEYLIGPRFEYQSESLLWITAGGSRIVFQDESVQTRAIWDAGITHRLPTITVSFETGRRYIDDPLSIVRREDRYMAAVKKETERTSLGFTAALREFGVADFLEEKRYSANLTFAHSLSRTVRGSYAVSVHKYERYPATAADTSTIIYLTDVRFDYLASDTLTISLEYRFTDSYSRETFSENYENNRIMAALKKNF